ncbi:MAG: ATP-binding protein [Chitinophagaceae bacterium]|nr:ATP-binding protein [Chitinophagaceae bacterium]
MKKVVIIGGESTGKSTLSEQLAAYYQTVWVPEYARTYLDNLGREYEKEDLLEIAKGQLKSEFELESLANQFLFCDTDLLVIKVWSEHRYHFCDVFILEQIKNQKYDAYIITSPDMPWVYDKLREHPSEEMRIYFFEKYIQLVREQNVPFVVVKGNERERLNTAIGFLKKEMGLF